jgi:hypothetical protein
MADGRFHARGFEGLNVGRPRATTAKRVHVVAEAMRERALPILSNPDPRLVTLVRLLARQAARDFVQGELVSRNRERLPD